VLQNLNEMKNMRVLKEDLKEVKIMYMLVDYML
jgi:hypothetical protein